MNGNGRERIDITMTAVIRPDLLRRTLASFKENLFQDWPCRLIINVDPVGGDPADANDVIDVARDFFPDMKCRIPKTASFPDAFIWVLRQSTSRLVFHLEDDWEMATEVNLRSLLVLFDQYLDLALLRLSGWPGEETKVKAWNKFVPWNGKFYEIPQNLKKAIGFSGHPSLIRKVFLDDTVPFLNPSNNPEKQFHYNSSVLRRLLKYRFGIYSWPGAPRLIRDTGERWRNASGWKKKGSKAFFTEWERA